jgi:beta-N-acetylhexosaminidase
VRVRSRGRSGWFPTLVLACAALSACATTAPPPESGPPQAPVGSTGESDEPQAASRDQEARTDGVLATIRGMTLREKIAQQFIVWIPRGADRDTMVRLEELHPGGYILYPWNYATPEDARLLTAELASAGDRAAASPAIRPFIAVDQEGGRVAAFRFPGFPAAPSAFELGSRRDPSAVEASAFATALGLVALGCNMDLAPVADLYPLPDATIIGDRSFGPDPEATAQSVAAFVRGLLNGGIIPTLKHFPGHGASTVDSHADLPVVRIGIDELRSGALVPFREGIRAGAPVVMTAHILYPALDAERPATLSPAILKNILRDELGFDGIILTDGFEMGALAKRFGKEESLAAALDAGVTMVLLYNRYDPVEMVDIVEKLLRDGRLTEKTIDANVARILRVKADFGLLGPSRGTTGGSAWLPFAGPAP